MKQRIEAVSRAYWMVLGAALVVIVLGVPLGDDGATKRALDELVTFDEGFQQKRAQIEATLLSSARREGAVELSDVLARVKGRGLPKLALGEKVAPVQPLVVLDLSSLAKIEALSSESASLPIATLDDAGVAALGEALSWRLSRAAQDGERYALQSVELLAERSSADAVAREAKTEAARKALLDAESELKKAIARHERLEELLEQRRKWRAARKVIARTNEERIEARGKREEAQKARDEAAASYEALAKEAAALKGEPGALVEGADEGKAYGVALAKLQAKKGSETLELRAAVPLVVEQATVPRITGAQLSTVKAEGYWDAVRGGTGAEGIATLRERFSWHYAYVEVAGVKLGGMTVVQLAPLLLLPFVLLLLRRCRSVTAGYNPYDPESGKLPRAGLGPVGNAVVLIALPLLGAALCTVSLLQLRMLPIVPVLAGLGAAALGARAYVVLRDLMEMRDAVRHSLSSMPPAPS